MTDEQIIYLSPEEELTSVRERLEHAQAKRIILVIPSQTQLRSHVGWRLLHARTRELGKEVLVISSDRQIRAVVKAAGFKVADSQESTPTGASRPPSRPSRSTAGGRTASRLRTPPGKSTPDRGSSTDIRVPRPERGAPAQFTPGEQRAVTQEPVSRVSEPGVGEITNPASPIVEAPGGRYGPNYEFRIEPRPSLLRPVPEQELEEPDQLTEDYNFAQGIRQAAQQDTFQTAPEPARMGPQTPAGPPRGGDPFTLLDDRYSSRIPEQRGGAPIDELDEGIADISSFPTEVISHGDIEDLGDEGNVVLPGQPPSPPSQPDVEERESAASSRFYGTRPRSARQGALAPDVEEEDTLPPAQGQSARNMPPTMRPATRPPSTPAPVSARRPAVQQPLAPSRPQAPAPASSRGTTPRPAAQTRAGASRPPLARPTAPRRGTGGIVFAVILILLLVLAGALAYFGPSADVTITLPMQNFSTPVAFTTVANSPQNAPGQTVRAQTLVFDKDAEGQGSATGTQKVGTTAATGKVSFTNNGTQPVDIPPGSVVATASGVRFVTTVDAFVNTQNSIVGNTLPVPVQAQSLGQSGNVPANSITVIPGDSLNKIAQASGIPTSAVKLSVTNTDAITNGGLGNAASVTAADVAKLQSSLSAQLQHDIQSWLAGQVHTGDVQGKPVQTETMTATPAQGAIAPGGTFIGRLHVHVTVLVVRAADLQTAAQAQFNVAAAKAKANYGLIPQGAVSLGKNTTKSCTPAIGTTSLTLCYTASGQIAPQLPVQTVRDSLAGKTVKDATDYLTSITNSVAGTSNTVISIHPDFFPWLPFWSQRIAIHFKFVQAAPTPKK